MVPVTPLGNRLRCEMYQRKRTWKTTQSVRSSEMGFFNEPWWAEGGKLSDSIPGGGTYVLSPADSLLAVGPSFTGRPRF